MVAHEVHLAVPHGVLHASARQGQVVHADALEGRASARPGQLAHVDVLEERTSARPGQLASVDSLEDLGRHCLPVHVVAG